MAVGTCLRSNKEQLYMLELLVDHLNLTAEKIQEIGITPLCIRLNFIDFPTFEIIQDSIPSKNEEEEKFVSDNKISDGYIDFNIGKSCLFSKQPQDFVQAIQLQPLKIGIYKLSKRSVCSLENEDLPVCETQVPLSGCLCDQVAMIMNDIHRLPKPYTLKNTYNLIDSQGRPSGSIAIFIRLSCFGKSIVTYFAFQDESFLFKNSQSSNEFQCVKISSDHEKLVDTGERMKDKINNNNSEEHNETELTSLKLKAVVGLVPICQELVERDRDSEIIPLSFTVCQTENRSNDKNVDFTKSPNNLNNEDSMYQKYSSSPTCVCSSNGTYLKLSTDNFPYNETICTGGSCNGTSSLDLPLADHPDVTKTISCYSESCYAGNSQSDTIHRLRCCSEHRMRGGGGCCQHDGEKTGYINYTRGTDMLQMASSSSNLPNQSNNVNVWTTSSDSRNTSGKPVECYCSGEAGVAEMNANSVTTMKGNTVCSKKSSLNIDYLIRAFKETQDFVDSIGKIPGLAGLGLMDPSESPYFGRNKDYTETTYSVKNPFGPIQNVPLSNTSNLQCFAPCNTQMRTNPTVMGTGSVTSTGRFVTTREAPADTIFTVSNKQKKKDEKTERSKESKVQSLSLPEIETSSYREPKLKLKRKQVQGELNSVQTGIKSPVTKRAASLHRSEMNNNGGSGNLSKVSNNKTLEKNKQQVKGRQNLPGPAGDRSTFTNSHIKIKKGLMKSINSMGTKYNPGVNYGHKNCLEFRTRVPANMGWLWNTNMIPGKMKPRLGWKPGAISKYLYDLLEEAKASSDSVLKSRPSTLIKGKKGKVAKNKSLQSLGKDQRVRNKEGKDDCIEFPPTLHIHRKQGTYYVTMHPVKQNNMDQEQLGEPVKPLQFEITKNKDNDSVSSSSTDLDMEIEFSPPTAITRYRKKSSVVHIDTQVKQQDILDTFKLARTKEGKGKKGKKNKSKK